MDRMLYFVAAGLEPDKGALSDKETARIMAISGPEGSPRMVTIFPGELMEKTSEGFQIHSRGLLQEYPHL